MARKLNLGYSEIVKTSIMHEIDNGRRFDSFGALLSLRSPQRQPIIRDLDPKVASEQGRLSHYLDGSRNPIARVQLQWRPQVQATGLSSTRRNKADLISNAQNESGVVTDNVDYNLHNEFSEGFDQGQLMKLEPAAEAYLNAVNSGLTLNNPDSAMWQGLAEIGERFMEKMETGIMQPLNNTCLTNLIAGIGDNLVDGTDAATIPTIVLFDDEGRASKDIVHYINQLRREHQMKSKPIVIGGSLFTKWMDASAWTAVQDLGTDFDRVMRQLPFEFYYDSMIDSTYGEGRMIISEPGSAALCFLQEHGDVIKAKKVGDTTFTSAAISLMGFDTELTTVEMDLRIIEDDSAAYPKVYAAPSVRSAIFTRPEGTIKTYGGFEGVTGIFGIRVVEKAADI